MRNYSEAMLSLQAYYPHVTVKINEGILHVNANLENARRCITLGTFGALYIERWSQEMIRQQAQSEARDLSMSSTDLDMHPVPSSCRAPSSGIFVRGGDSLCPGEQ